jgi:hypothetical protein
MNALLWMLLGAICGAMVFVMWAIFRCGALADERMERIMRDEARRRLDGIERDANEADEYVAPRVEGG